MSSPEPAKTPEIQKFTKTYELFDENLVLVKKEVEVNFQPATTYEEAVNRLGNDAEKLLSGLNAQLRREAFTEARKAAGVSGGINRQVLMEFIKPYRELPQFASLISTSDKRKATAEEWDKQTNAIIEQVIKPVPVIFNAIKARSLQVAEEEEN